MHGASPIAPLVEGADGNFYGTTTGGGCSGSGVIFKIAPTGNLTILHTLNGTIDGAQLYGGLISASDGNFYGDTAYGGTVNSPCPDGCGTFFQITPQGPFSVLHSFDLNDGASPQVSPFQNTTGMVYGDVQAGGVGNVGCQAGFCGVFYSRTNSSTLPAFVRLLTYFGKEGATVEFLGQGFVSGKPRYRSTAPRRSPQWCRAHT